MTSNAIRIEVTQADIDEATRRVFGDDQYVTRSSNCPIAVAVGRMAEGAGRGWASGTYAGIDLDGGVRGVTWRLPADAIDFQRRFDDHKTVKPVTFEALPYSGSFLDARRLEMSEA